MIINRYIKEFDRMKEDFKFLPDVIKSFKGEIELSLRQNYFNLYYKGNSLAKVNFEPDGKYELVIHKSFFEKTSAEKDERFLIKKNDDGTYVHLMVEKGLLHPLLQKKYLAEFCSRVKKKNYSEELTLEQMIITDNLSRDDLLIIDRQVTDTKLKGRLDLLALKKVEGNRFRFIVIEVKLGNNKELSSSVAGQLEGYIQHIEEHFEDYKTCYEKNYQQKKSLGLVENPFDTIEIVPGVRGMVVVSGYSGIARKSIKELKKHHPSLAIQEIKYRLDVGHLR